jgi:hypothetical protein
MIGGAMEKVAAVSLRKPFLHNRLTPPTDNLYPIPNGKGTTKSYHQKPLYEHTQEIAMKAQSCRLESQVVSPNSITVSTLQQYSNCEFADRGESV